MQKFICTSEAKPALNHKGSVIGMEDKRVLCIAHMVSKKRFYRKGMNNLPRSFKPKVFARQKAAQDLANEINKAYKDDFKVEAINELIEDWNGTMRNLILVKA